MSGAVYTISSANTSTTPSYNWGPDGFSILQVGRISTTVARDSSTIQVNGHNRGSLTAHVEAGVVRVSEVQVSSKTSKRPAFNWISVAFQQFFTNAEPKTFDLSNDLRRCMKQASITLQCLHRRNSSSIKGAANDHS